MSTTILLIVSGFLSETKVLANHHPKISYICRKALFQRIGCISPLDPWSNNSLPMCTSPGSIFTYEEFYFGLSFNYKEYILTSTGCALPCRYRQYSLATPAASSQMSSGDVLLWFANNFIIINNFTNTRSCAQVCHDRGGKARGGVDLSLRVDGQRTWGSAWSLPGFLIFCNL